MRSLSIVVMSQIKLIPTPSWLVYFVLKAQPFFINFGHHNTQQNDSRYNDSQHNNCQHKDSISGFGWDGSP